MHNISTHGFVCILLQEVFMTAMLDYSVLNLENDIRFTDIDFT